MRLRSSTLVKTLSKELRMLTVLSLFEAGYVGNEKMVFVGQVTTVTEMKQGVDVITLLKCKDGFTPINGIRYSKYFARGSGTYADVFRDIVAEFGRNGIASSPDGVILNQAVPPTMTSPEDTTLEKSWAYAGYLRQALDELCKEFYYKWQIVQSRLFIYL